MRHTRALILACALLGAAPTIHAQTVVSLRTTTGSPIAYQIGVPKEWEVEQDGEEVLFVSSGEASVFVRAVDFTTRSKPLPVSEAEDRRIVTNMVMSSDSLLFGLLAIAFANVDSDLRFEGATREIRTLGGERAAYMASWGDNPGHGRGRLEAYMTVKDGIGYILVFGAAENAYKRHEQLFARIRDSFTLASAPAPGFRTAEPPREAPGRHRDGTWTSR